MNFKVTHNSKRVMLSVNHQLLVKRKNINESLVDYVFKVEKIEICQKLATFTMECGIIA